MMNFHRGMRRVAVVIWVIGCLISFSLDEPFASHAKFRYALAAVSMWSAGYWLFVFVVRWIWLGFAEKSEAPPS